MIGSWFHFERAVCLKASGKDVRRYLHNRLSNDIKQLRDGHSLLAAALNAQGRVQGLFTVFAEENDSFLLVADAGVRQALFSTVGAFIVADRVSLEDISGDVFFAHLAVPGEIIEALTHEIPELRSRPRNRLGVAGYDVLALGEASTRLAGLCREKFGASLLPEDYLLIRCKQGFPMFPEEINDQVILTECGDRSTVSFSKGCYVGQEVIERSDAIGKVPRSIERIALRGVDAPGSGTMVLNASGGGIGKIVTCASDPIEGRTYAFALLRNGLYQVGDPISSGALEGEICGIEWGNHE